VTRVVVVGNGMAGARVVDEIRRRDDRLQVTVFGAEPHAAYNRVLLSSLLAGTATVDDIRLAAAHDVADGLVVHTGVTVRRIDRDRRLVVADDGTWAGYDVLVLATGSSAWIPPINGLVCDGGLIPGATVFRTVGDCHEILDAATTANRVVVIGGGLLGLEAARGLTARGLEVEVLHHAGHLMERQLDPLAGKVLARTLADLGVRARVAVAAAGIEGADRVRGVRLADGTLLPADLVVIACGVRPEVTLARAAGLAVDQGIVVDDALRSVTDPEVYAIGECAQHDGQVYGLVAPAWEQAKVAADRVSGVDPAATYAGSRVVTRLKAAGVDLATMGETHLDADAADETGAEVVQFSDPARGTYKKVVIRDGRLVGAILLGEIGTVGTVTQLFDRQSPVPPDRLALLFPGPRWGEPGAAEAERPAHIPDRATICQCNGVTKGAITRCWLAGASTTADVVAETRATTGCGTCRPTVEGIVDWLAASDAEMASADGESRRSIA
jgi:assimilatory nitrate reductase electron transfer subunit